MNLDWQYDSIHNGRSGVWHRRCIAQVTHQRSSPDLPSRAMASMIKEVAKRAATFVVKEPGVGPEAWETTAKLRNQFVYTTMDAMPARVAAASAEWASLRAKVTKRDFTVNEVGVGVVRAVELYAFFLVGRVIGSRSMTP